MKGKSEEQNTPKITEKPFKLKLRQKEIIDNLIRFRYLTRPQIQALLNHKAKENIRTWLNELAEIEYIFRFYEKEFAGKPSIFCLEKKSIPYLRKKDIDEHIIKWVYDEKTRPQVFRAHCIFIADIYLSLLQLVHKTHATLKFYTKTDLYDYMYLILPHPDCYFTIQEKNGQTQYYFLDLFDDRAFMFKRMHQYCNYYNKHYWQTKTKKQFPNIIFICPDDSAKKSIYRFIQSKAPFDRPTFYVTTKQDIQKKGMCKDILMKVTA